MNNTHVSVPNILIGDQLPIGKFKVHSCFKRVANLINFNSEIVFISNSIDVLSSNGIYIRNIDVSTIETLEISEDSILINEQKYNLSSLDVYNSELNYDTVNLIEFECRVLNIVEQSLCLFPEKSLIFIIVPEREKHFSTGFDHHFALNAKKGAELIVKGDIIGGVKILKGTGYGLTPSGDDFIAGMLWGLHYIQAVYGFNLVHLRNEIYNASISKNLITNSFLNQALKGRYFWSFKNLVSLTVQNKDTYDALKEVTSLGASSGGDLLSGYIFTITHKLGT